MQAYDITCRNIILSDKSHHSSHRSFRMTAGSEAFAAVQGSPESGSICSVQCTAAVGTALCTDCLQQALVVLSVGWLADTRHFAHCWSKLCWLSVPAGGSQRRLSYDVMSLFKLVVFRTAKGLILINVNSNSCNLGSYLGSNLGSNLSSSLCNFLHSPVLLNITSIPLYYNGDILQAAAVTRGVTMIDDPHWRSVRDEN
jgi:hypothetical protein